MLKLVLPPFLVDAIVGFAAYLKGLIDQRSADQKAGEDADAEAEKTAEEKRAGAEALDHDQLQHEEDTWTAP